MKERQASGEALTQAARAYMESHSAERFSLQEMAGSLYVNGSYLLRTFKRYTGMTPLAFHHRVRCEKAKDMLTHSDLSVSDIGDAAGFVSSSHFSHVFRKIVGCTPSEYRKSHRTG